MKKILFYFFIVINSYGYSQGGDCPLTRLAEDLVGASDEFKIILNTNGGFEAYKAVNNAPSIIRQNITILREIEVLLNTGFNKLDIDILIESLNKLKARSIPNADLEKIAEYSLKARKHTGQYANLKIETDLFKQIDELASSAKFKNPEDLKYFLSETQLLQNITDNPGNLEALNESVRVIKQGNDVILEGKGAIKGDIVDVSNKISYQYKAFNGDKKSSFNNNLKSAAKQFNSEPAAEGYSKVAKIKPLNKNQPDFNSSTQTLKVRLQKYYNQNKVNKTGINLRKLDRIEIENSTGLHKFMIVNDLVQIIF